MRTRSAMESARILCITRARWTFTVFSLIPSSAATCLFSSPRTTRRSTSASRGVSARARFSSSESWACSRRSQVFGRVWLGEKIDRAALHGAHAGDDVAVAGDEDDGDGLARRQQGVLELESVPARHLEIEEETGGLVRGEMREEFVGGGKGLHQIAGDGLG